MQTRLWSSCEYRRLLFSNTGCFCCLCSVSQRDTLESKKMFPFYSGLSSSPWAPYLLTAQKQNKKFNSFSVGNQLLGKTAISTRLLGFKTLHIDSGTLRAVVNHCLEFASVVDWYCSCRLLCRVAVVCCVGHFELVLEGGVRRVFHSRDVNRVNGCESTNLSASSVLSYYRLVNVLHWIICDVGQFELTWERRLFSHERFGLDVNMYEFYKFYRLGEQIFQTYIFKLYLFYFHSFVCAV